LCYNAFKMSKISYLEVPEEYYNQFRKTISPNRRFTIPRMLSSNRIISRKRKKALTAQTFLYDIAEKWWLLSENEREDWREAGAVRNWPGWRLFVNEQAQRINKNIQGVGVPSLLHQGRVGCLSVNSPAEEIKIVQPHPEYYFIPRIVPGNYPLKEVIWIHEDFKLPLKMGLNYKSNLEALSNDAKAVFYVNVWHSYQGVDLSSIIKIDLQLSSDWKSVEKEISSVIGYVVQYNAYIHLKDIEGSLYFDNVVLEHSGYNWARDPYCENIDEDFMAGFFQILTPWIPVITPEGASYFSDYFDFS